MSNLKLNRFFCGGYIPDYAKMHDMGYIVLKLPKPIITALSSDQGFGQIKGTTKKLGENYSPVPVCAFRKDSRLLLWETKSKADGSYEFRNIAAGLECFVIAFDPNNHYNAVIQDKVIAK